jgi:lipopolysaccharide transport system ATP-binding protein
VRQGILKYKTYDALKDINFSIFRGYHCPPEISIALLTLQSGFDLELTGTANIILHGMLLGFTKEEILAKMDRIIAFSELCDHIDDPVKTYSTGMRARLGFAVGIELSPDILLIDEVLGVGDAKFRKKAVAAMEGKMNSDQTVVFVSHDMKAVRELCNRVIWIENGVTRMDGPSTDVVMAYFEYLKQNQDG